MIIKNLHTARQIDIMRLEDNRVRAIALKYGLDLDVELKSDRASTEEKLLEILERYEAILDRAQIFLTEGLESIDPRQIDDDTIESLAILCEIQEKESWKIDEILFDFPLNLSLSKTIEKFCKNSKKIIESYELSTEN